MSFIVFASLESSKFGLWGIILMSVGHGFISAKLFYLLSFIYTSTGSRNVLVLKRNLNNYGIISFLLAMGVILNSSAPFSIKFFGELFLFIRVVPSLIFWRGILIFFAKVVGGLLSVFFYLILSHGLNQSFTFYVAQYNFLISFFLSFFCLKTLVLLSFVF